MKKYCVYSHADERGVVFYVGCGKRRKRPGDFSSRSFEWKEAATSAGKIKVEILFESDDEIEAKEFERSEIMRLKPIANKALLERLDDGNDYAAIVAELRERFGSYTRIYEHCGLDFAVLRAIEARSIKIPSRIIARELIRLREDVLRKQKPTA